MATAQGELSGRVSGASALEPLLSRYYDEFRRIARRVLRGDAAQLNIQPTELVHEAALRILASDGIWVRDQAHFLALGARTMRLALIDEVRRRKAAKRSVRLVTIWDECAAATADGFDIEDFDDLLDRLATIAPEGARIVELRFYAGMSLAEIGEALALSESTIHRRWRSARAWLLKELAADA